MADCSRACECSRAFRLKSVTLVDVRSGDELSDVTTEEEVTGFGRQHAQKGNAVKKRSRLKIRHGAKVIFIVKYIINVNYLNVS